MIKDNEQLRGLIEDAIGGFDEDESILLLEGDEYAPACIGITTDHCLVYDWDLMVESLAKYYREEDDTDEDATMKAIEWIDYNTLRALPYMHSQGNVPIIINRFVVPESEEQK